jgi:hypothetical protein
MPTNQEGSEKYEKGLVDKIRVNPKKFWRYASSKSKTKAGIPNLYITDDM